MIRAELRRPLPPALVFAVGGGVAAGSHGVRVGGARTTIS